MNTGKTTGEVTTFTFLNERGTHRVIGAEGRKRTAGCNRAIPQAEESRIKPGQPQRRLTCQSCATEWSDFVRDVTTH